MKKIKNNKGIALVSLTIAVIILVILTSMLVYNAKNGIKLRNLTMMQNDIDVLTNKITSYYAKYGDIPAEIEYLGDINFEKQPNDDDKYYVIDLSAFEDITLNYGLDYNNIGSSTDTQNYADVYIVNKQSMHVYYARGIEMDGIMYYTNDEDEEIKLIGDRTGLKVGDYIDYVPDKNTTGYSTNKLTSTITGSTSNTSTITQDKQYARDGEGMTWQILRIYEDGGLDLIGSPTSQAIYLKGANGYNNGVTVMNDICKTLYSRGDIEARSVNYEDLDHWLTDAGKATRDRYSSSGGVTYGDTHKYTSSTYRYYPNLYAQEIGAGIDTENVKTTGLEISDEGNATGSTKANSSLKVTQTYWTGVMTSPNYGNGYNALKTSGSYWVASRYVNCESDMAVFGLWTVDNFLVGGIFMSYNHPMNINDYIRPVVTLSPSVQIENCTGDNSVDNMHKITKY